MRRSPCCNNGSSPPTAYNAFFLLETCHLFAILASSPFDLHNCPLLNESEANTLLTPIPSNNLTMSFGEPNDEFEFVSEIVDDSERCAAMAFCEYGEV